MPQFQADQKPTILIISIRRFADVTVRQIRVVEERGAGEGVGVDEGVPAGERRRG